MKFCESEIFIWKWILAQALTFAVFFDTLQALGSHQLLIWKKADHFMICETRWWGNYPPGSGTALCHNNTCGLDVWLSSSVYLNSGLNLFHSFLQACFFGGSIKCVGKMKIPVTPKKWILMARLSHLTVKLVWNVWN